MLTTPRSIRPVTTVPRPEIENTSSIGIRNVLSVSRFGVGMYESSASTSFWIEGIPISEVSPSNAFKAEPRITGVSSPGNSYSVNSSRISISTSSTSSSSSTKSTLFIYTTIYGTPTWRDKRMCSRV